MTRTRCRTQVVVGLLAGGLLLIGILQPTYRWAHPHPPPALGNGAAVAPQQGTAMRGEVAVHVEDASIGRFRDDRRSSARTRAEGHAQRARGARVGEPRPFAPSSGLSPQGSVTAYTEGFAAQTPRERVRRLRGLALLRQAQGAECAVAALHDPVTAVRLAAIDAAWAIAGTACRPALEQMLDDPRPVVRDRAAATLRRLAEQL